MYSKVNEEALDKIASMNDIDALEKLMENDIQNIYEYIMFLARDSGLVDTIYDSIVEFFSSNVCDIYETNDHNSLLTI
jgi:CTP synthase (UTP-ammonia lyase)